MEQDETYLAEDVIVHNCRRTQSALTERQAKARGVTALPPPVAPAPGFGAAPGTPGAEWTPDVSDAPPALQAAFRQKQSAGPPPLAEDERLPRGHVRGDSAEVVEAELPHVAAILGDRLRVDGVMESERIRNAVIDLGRLPNRLLERMREVTTDIHLANDIIPNMGRSGVAAKIAAQARPNEGAGDSYDVASAVLFKGTYGKLRFTEALVSKNQGGSVAPAIHELAHALDFAEDAAWLSKAPGFMAAWQAFKAGGSAMSQVAYYTNDNHGPEEAFAESFAVLWHTGGRDHGREMVAARFGPELAEYMAREHGWQTWGGG